jgi:hypothetical protein
MGGACGMQGREYESSQDFGGKARRKETTQKTVTDEKMGSKWILRRLVWGGGGGGVVV